VKVKLDYSQLNACEGVMENFRHSFEEIFENQENSLTPYLHILCCHLTDLIYLHGNLNQYENQGFEASHKFNVQHFFKGSNQGGGRADQRVPVFGDCNSTSSNSCAPIQQFLCHFYSPKVLRINHAEKVVPPFVSKRFPTWENPKYKVSTRKKESIFSNEIVQEFSDSDEGDICDFFMDFQPDKLEFNRQPGEHDA